MDEINAVSGVWRAGVLCQGQHLGLINDSTDCGDCNGAFNNLLRCRHINLDKVNVLSSPRHSEQGGPEFLRTSARPYLVERVSSILSSFSPRIFLSLQILADV